MILRANFYNNSVVTSTFHSLSQQLSLDHTSDSKTDTKTHRETDSKEREARKEKRKNRRKGGQRKADKTKKLRTRQTGALKPLQQTERENVQHVVNMLTHGRTHSLNLSQQIHSPYGNQSERREVFGGNARFKNGKTQERQTGRVRVTETGWSNRSGTEPGCYGDFGMNDQMNAAGPRTALATYWQNSRSSLHKCLNVRHLTARRRSSCL